MMIKVGDIFYVNHGIAAFYQVVKVYESGRVRIREIEKEEKETECGYEFLATPIPNKFCPKREVEEFEKRYFNVVDNDKGAIKLIQYYDDGTPYISFLTENGYLYDGEPVISSYYYVWMK